MSILARCFIAFGFCVACVIALQSADYAEALDRAGLVGARARAPENLNLGDCLRPDAGASWPAAYRAICNDLAAAITPPPDPDAPITTASIARHSKAQDNNLLALRRPSDDAPAHQVETPPHTGPACLIDTQGITTHHSISTKRIEPQRTATPNAAGQNRTGVALFVDTDCVVASPVAGRVMFAGDFKGYRGTVILRLTNGHQLIIAGFDRVDVARGQSLSKGAYLGITSKERAPALASSYGRAEDSDESAKHTLLYYDMRNAKGDKQKIDWLSHTG